ncbi:MAG: nucleotidyltransferase domain-containing protein [Candidatus Woesearchaeota archaeon]|nr:nucleotidyltransferase domain-containing protein [Candidatus Woesearchaeota archaeon]
MVQLIEILGNKKLIEILSFFITSPAAEISQTALIKKTKIAKATAVKWMDFLVKNDFLNCKKIGVTNLYRLNNDNLIIKQLKVTNTIIQLQDLSRLKDKNMEIYLYGSSSRGEDMENSDIDLLIIGDVKRNEIINLIDDLSKKINKKINFNIFKYIEWSMMQKKDNAYYERVEKDKMRLL